MMQRLDIRLICLLLSLVIEGCAVDPIVPREPGTYEVFGKKYKVMQDSLGYREIGIASWYGKKFHGNLTANGEIYDMHSISAAHKTLPLPTFVKVTNLENGKSMTLRVNDRGPFYEDRIIDLSRAAAKQLNFEQKGTTAVVVEALDEMNYPERASEEINSSYYLQTGAFSEKDRALLFLQAIKALISQHGYEFNIRLLESKIDDGSLHKVWIGPIYGELHGYALKDIIEEAGMGKPVKIIVD